MPTEVTDETWRRILDPTTPDFGALVAERDGVVVVFANYVLHLYTWSTGKQCYLHDFYVDPDVRFGCDTVEGLRIRPGANRPQASQSLLDEAEKVVSRGEAAFIEWFNGITADQRKSIGKPKRDELLAKARAMSAPPAAEQPAAESSEEPA